jgi:hypothetical protein
MSIIQFYKESKSEQSQVPVAHTYNPSYSGEIRRITVQSQPGQMIHKTLSQKYPTQKGLV